MFVLSSGLFLRRRSAIGGTTALLVMLLSSSNPSVLSQTKWFKYEGNPVLKVGPPGSWDGNLVIPSRVLRYQSRYRMWYTGFSGTRYWHIGYAESPDGIRWRKHKSNPVLKAGPELWDNSGSSHSYVAPSGSGFQMWYTGGNDQRILQIGYAASNDGLAWKKTDNLNPILRVATPGAWDSRGLSRTSILGPDSLGHYKLWFAGEDSTGIIKIGYATGTSPTSWTIAADPVLEPGTPGSWNERSVFYPRVLYRDHTFEMWYGGMRNKGYRTRRVGYATSSDGIHWLESHENPVLTTGPYGSWDYDAVLVGEVLFDGTVYHMWYHGISQSLEVGVGQIGYAISPKGTQIEIGPPCVRPGNSIRLRLRVEDPTGLSLSAIIRSGEGQLVKQVPLFDDGRHGDGLPSDGLLANSWVPQEEGYYAVDIKLRRRAKTFVLDNAAQFSTIGPVRFEGLEYMGDATPSPGDTVLLKLMLGNHGRTAAARSVEASLSSTDSFVTSVAGISPAYGDIAPDSTVATLGYYRLFIRPDCPVDTDVKLTLSISSLGVPYWQDAMVIHVLPPWWRTQWAFVSYALVVLGSVVTTARFVGVRKLKRRIQQLERDRALERERTRISEDMHDEVGARLTEIGILGELAKKDISDPQKAEQQIQKITETSREVISNISEIIWAMNARNDALDDLVAYLREYAWKYLGSAAISCRFEIPDEIPKLHLSTEARRNIFLVVKETLHNVAKHSHATEVLVRMVFSPRALGITIEDNGLGFETGRPSRFGNGLSNMTKRMSDIGGRFEIRSIPGQGTRVNIHAKLGEG